MMRTSSPVLLVTLAAAAASIVPAAPAGAAAFGPFPQDSTTLISAGPGSDQALGVPAGYDNAAYVSGDGSAVAFGSTSDGLSSEDDDGYLNAFVKNVSTGVVTLVGRDADGNPAHADVYPQGISDDGTKVTLLTTAQLTSQPTGGRRQAYVRDLVAGTTTLVSRLGSAAAADRDVLECTISGDGTRVAFTTDATNLSPVDTHGKYQVYTRRLDVALPSSVLVSRADGGGTAVAGDDSSLSASLSDDGSVVAFASGAKNLAGTTDPDGTFDVFTRVGTQTRQLTAGNGHSTAPAVSGNGTYVAFPSAASNLLPADPDTIHDLYRSRVDQTELVLVSYVHGSSTVKGGGVTQFTPAISAAGNRVAFTSNASDFVSGDTNGRVDVFVRTIGANSTQRVDVGDGAAGVQAPTGGYLGGLDAAGQKVAFVSADALNPGDQPNHSKVYLRDLSVAPATTRHVSRPAGSAPFVNDGGAFRRGKPSADGRVVAFEAQAPGLVTDDVDLDGGIYVRDVTTGAVTLVSRATGATGEPANRFSRLEAISADGTRVLFSTQSSNLGFANPANRTVLALRDVVAGTTTLAAPAAGGGVADQGTFSGTLSSDGRHVAFESRATDIVADDLHGKDQVFVRDLDTGVTTVVSRDGAGAIGSEESGSPSLSADGRVVAFVSEADLAGPVADTEEHLFVRDTVAGTTVAADLLPGGGVPVGIQASQPTISDDGRRVAFTSEARLADADPPGDTDEDVFVRDLTTGVTSLASRGSGGGAAADDAAEDPVLSRDGTAVAYVSRATNLVSGAVGQQVYLTTLGDGVTRAVSRATGADGGLVVSRDPDDETVALGGLTADGGCVVVGTTDYAAPGPLVTTYETPQLWMRAALGTCPKPAPVVVPAPTPTPTPGPGGGVTPDRVAPVFTKVSLSAKRFYVGKKRTAVSAAARRRKAPAGTTLRFTLSEQAKVTVTLERERRVKRKLRRTKAGTITRRTVKAGKRTLAFSGRLGKKALPRGTYRVTLRATDAAGNVSKVSRVRFTVVKKGAKA